VATGSDIKLLLATGFCGGFTTFSAFAFENLELFKSGQYLTALLYIILSVVLGILAVILGAYLIK
jgi:CrcB protein